MDESYLPFVPTAHCIFSILIESDKVDTNVLNPVQCATNVALLFGDWMIDALSPYVEIEKAGGLQLFDVTDILSPIPYEKMCEVIVTIPFRLMVDALNFKPDRRELPKFVKTCQKVRIVSSAAPQFSLAPFVVGN